MRSRSGRSPCAGSLSTDSASSRSLAVGGSIEKMRVRRKSRRSAMSASLTLHGVLGRHSSTALLKGSQRMPSACRMAAVSGSSSPAWPSDARSSTSGASDPAGHFDMRADTSVRGADDGLPTAGDSCASASSSGGMSRTLGGDSWQRGSRGSSGSSQTTGSPPLQPRPACSTPTTCSRLGPSATTATTRPVGRSHGRSSSCETSDSIAAARPPAAPAERHGEPFPTPASRPLPCTPSFLASAGASLFTVHHISIGFSRTATSSPSMEFPR
mmetsp:Transcript_26432/g.78493  ORF Transcript_26432/g.78493 Transcript_26432/m.78493 type:complete len:270 (-) Transcript_26432:156-965(-)